MLQGDSLTCESLDPQHQIAADGYGHDAQRPRTERDRPDLCRRHSTWSATQCTYPEVPDGATVTIHATQDNFRPTCTGPASTCTYTVHSNLTVTLTPPNIH